VAWRNALDIFNFVFELKPTITDNVTFSLYLKLLKQIPLDSSKAALPSVLARKLDRLVLAEYQSAKLDSPPTKLYAL